MSAEPIVLYWGFRHFHLFVSRCESIEEAAREAWRDSQQGEASFVCVEVIEDGQSRKADIAALWNDWNAEENAIWEAQKQRPIVSVTQLQAPEIPGDQGTRQWADLDWYYDAADARRHAEHVANYGERVRFTIK